MSVYLSVCLRACACACACACIYNTISILQHLPRYNEPLAITNSMFFAYTNYALSLAQTSWHRKRSRGIHNRSQNTSFRITKIARGQIYLQATNTIPQRHHGNIYIYIYKLPKLLRSTNDIHILKLSTTCFNNMFPSFQDHIRND